MKNLWFSQKCADELGFYIGHLPSGKTIAFTEITERKKSNKNWSDQIFLMATELEKINYTYYMPYPNSQSNDPDGYIVNQLSAEDIQNREKLKIEAKNKLKEIIMNNENLYTFPAQQNSSVFSKIESIRNNLINKITENKINKP